MNSIVEMLLLLVSSRPDDAAFIYLRDGEEDEEKLTYSDFHIQASAVATELERRNARGQTILILHETNIEYLVAFFGCLYAKAIAVPAYPVMKKKHTPRLQAIIDNSNAKIALASADSIEKMKDFGLGIEYLCSVDLQGSTVWEKPQYEKDEIAYLQYTSGSTSDPKGVMVTHGSILANAKGATEAAALDIEGNRCLISWLPLFHDMGIMTGPISALYTGVPLVLMNPMHFIQKPLRWLQAISNYRGSCSGAPTFAYDLCNARITTEDMIGLDLSSWTCAFVSAEPVKPSTLRRFAKKFSACGFKSDSLFPCYGLAEATLLLSCVELNKPYATKKVKRDSLESGRSDIVNDVKGDEKFYELVSSGRGFDLHHLITVDTDSLEICEEGRVGEIWANGPSIAKGYWGNEAATRQTFQAKIKSGNKAKGLEGLDFLRTGDLGFFSEGDLFITGRLKDLIIIRGRNIYPQDIETVVQKISSDLRIGRGAAFTSEIKDEQKLIIVQEVVKDAKIDPMILINSIRRVVAEEYEIEVHGISLIAADELPITSSGKVKRNESRNKLINKQINLIASWDAAAELSSPKAAGTADRCRELIATHLRMDVSELEYTKTLRSYGMDSLTALNLSYAFQLEFEFDIPVILLLNEATLVSILDLIRQQEKKSLIDQVGYGKN